MPNDTTTVPQAVIDQLKLREGWRTDVYLDTLGKPTAGMGHLLTASENQQYSVGATVPDDVLNGWAQADTQTAYNAALRQASELNISDQNFINALASVNFQLGAGWNQEFKMTWADLQVGKWQQASAEAQDSAWYKQTPVRVQDFQQAILALAQPAPGDAGATTATA